MIGDSGIREPALEGVQRVIGPGVEQNLGLRSVLADGDNQLLHEVCQGHHAADSIADDDSIRLM